MKGVLKRIYFLVVELVECIISLISIFLFSSLSTARKISKLKENNLNNVHILVNGPSLKMMLDKHLDFFKNNDILTVNFFANSPFFSIIKPKYYVLLDPAFFGGDGSVVLSEKIQVLMDNLSSVSWKMTLFIPNSRNNIKDIVRRINNVNITVMPFCATRVTGFRWFRNRVYKLNLGIPSSKNVLLPSILLMLNKGYKIVYLYGAEFSWTKTFNVDQEDGKIYTDDIHFYDKTRIPLKKGEFKSKLSFLVETLNATDYYAEYAKFIGSNIINRTPGSFIDAFTYENPYKLKF